MEENNQKDDGLQAQHKHCDCHLDHPTKLGRVYFPSQKMGELYTLEEGLLKGTLFPELYQPYYRSDGCEKRRCEPIKHHDKCFIRQDGSSKN